MIAHGSFREDLYHRLAVFPIVLPPLRERRQDLLPLAESLLARISGELGRPTLRLDDNARERILEGAWPGNVRELANVLERAAILADGEVIRGDDLRIGIAAPGSGLAGRTIEEIEHEAIRRTLVEVGGNRRRAAERLGIGERTLYEKLKRFGIS
jgi:two-component system response regulator FlrC